MTRGRFILLLIASHGVALAFGLALRATDTEEPAAGGVVTAEPQQRLELSRFIVRPPDDPEEEEEDESPEAREKARREYEEKFAQMVEAIPADADVAAIVKAACSDKDKWPAREVEAAYAVWLMRDTLAALRWHVAWELERGSSSSAFNNSEEYFLNRKSPADLDQLMVADPEVGRSLLVIAIFATREKGLEQLVALATGLSQGDSRTEVIRWGIQSVEGLAPHLPALRAAMDERGMHEFLSKIGGMEHAADLTEPVRAAGFPESAVKVFEEEVAKNAEKWYIESLPLAERFRETKDLRELDQGIMREVPEWSDWFREFSASQIGADEFFAKLKARLPGSESIEPELRSYLFTKLFPCDSAAALNWLQAGQADWQPVVKAALEKEGWQTSFEEYLELAGSVSPTDAEASGLEEAMLGRLYDWWRRDPENCKTAVQRLHSGPLKDSLLEKIAKEEARQ